MASLDKPTDEEIRRALQVLTALVRDEYPEGRTLADIARVWSSASDDDAAALAVVEMWLTEDDAGLVHEPLQIGDVQATEGS